MVAVHAEREAVEKMFWKKKRSKNSKCRRLVLSLTITTSDPLRPPSLYLVNNSSFFFFLWNFVFLCDQILMILSDSGCPGDSFFDDFWVKFWWFTPSWASLGPVGCSRGVPDARKYDFLWILALIWCPLGNHLGTLGGPMGAYRSLGWCLLGLSCSI